LNIDEKHLSAAEIEALIKAQPGGIEADEQSTRIRELRHHLADCEPCRRLVSVHEESERTLNGLTARTPTEGTIGCPSENSLRALAGGILADDEASAILSHAVECDRCGPLLRHASELVSSEASPEEVSFISSLQSSKLSWQREVAKRLAGNNTRADELTRNRTRFWRFPSLRWILVGASVVACLFISVWVFRRSQPAYAENLLANAYSESRSMELRIASAKFAPIRVKRGKEDSNLEKPVALLEAETLIGKNLEKNPNSAKWLAAKGKADLLDANYDSAVVSLERALKMDPTATSAEADLASAYFLRGESTHRAIDYGAALNLLGKGLARSPDDPVLIFNRAIIAERMYLYAQALEDWEHYLRIDHSGSWAAEAQQRLDALKKKLKEREQGLAEPLLQPGELARADLGDSILRASIDQRLEDYYHLVLTDWLPRAYPGSAGRGPETDDIRKALSVLAGVAVAENRDRWLADLLVSAPADQFPHAVAALSETIRANDAGNYLVARARAVRARRLFEDANSQAGSLRAEFEMVYAIHLSHEGTLCLKVTGHQRKRPGKDYPWLGIQFEIERAICQGLMGNLGEAQGSLRQAISSARDAKYATLYVRAVGNAVEMESGTGNLNSAWERACDGLAFFWSRSIRPMQGYNLYVRLSSMADEQHRSYLQVSVWKQALAMIDSDEDYLLRAMAHSMAASAALNADMKDFANREFNEAERLFAAAPETSALTSDRIEAGVTLAGVEVRAGRLAEARALLRSLRPSIAELSDDYVAIQFYSVIGEVERRLGQAMEAERALRSAVALSETSLESLKSEMDRLNWTQLAANSYSNLVQLKLDAGDAKGALELWEWYRSAAARAGKKSEAFSHSGKYSQRANHFDAAALEGGPALPILQDVSEALVGMENRTVVSYALFNDELAIWMFDNRGIESRVLKKSSKEVDSLVSRFVDLCSDPRTDPHEIENASRPIYDILIGPIANRISPERTLILETERSLDRIPMNVLTDAKGHFLSDVVSVVSSPGFHYRGARRTTGRISSRSQALIVGVAMPNDTTLGQFNAVVEAESEAREIGRYFEAPRLFIGGQSTFARVKQELPKASIFHFAGHAVASDSESGLILSDRILSADLLDGLALQNLRLVVLSGCQTERGSSGSIEDYDSLVRMFARNGVPEVIASRWKVDSAATALFMEKFYATLISGKGVTESIREAQHALRTHPGTAHPYYWGAFTNFAAS
jgi:CHAT domain-containing protein